MSCGRPIPRPPSNLGTRIFVSRPFLSKILLLSGSQGVCEKKILVIITPLHLTLENPDEVHYADFQKRIQFLE